MVVTKLAMRPYYRRKRMLRFFIILLLVLVLASLGVSGYVGWGLTHPAKQPLGDSPANYQITYQDVEFASRGDAIKLKGWFLPAKKSDKTIILAHGYKKNRVQDTVPALPLAKSLVGAGYQVLMFDFRNSGESEGTLSSVGELEKNDILGALDWVKSNHSSQVSLFGFSMGATTSLLAAADDPSVAGVIADSPFNNLKSYLTDNLSVWSHLPQFPFTPLIMNMLPPITGLHPERVDAFSAVDRIYPRPILFIHSIDDDSIPYTNSETLWEKHKDKFEFWKTSKAKHIGSYKLDPVQYTARVLDFLARIK
ncbi:MAG: alpha/beta hydrolase [Bacilli bacterium]|jgi:dipeptidyl aminopeptidase/acylaminoacyl peptidase|nr:alpha/beta hydrolase [Bacilli bacterium]